MVVVESEGRSLISPERLAIARAVSPSPNSDRYSMLVPSMEREREREREREGKTETRKNFDSRFYNFKTSSSPLVNRGLDR